MGLGTKITGIAAIVVIAAILFMWNRDHRELKSENDAQKIEIAELRNWKEAAKEKLTQKDTVHDTVTVTAYYADVQYAQIDSMKVYYEIDERISAPVSDDSTNVVSTPIEGLNRTYAGTFTTPDFKINWRLVNGPTGRLIDIQPGSYEVYKQQIENNHLIEIEKEVPVEYRANHLYLTLMAGNPGTKWTEWTSFDANLTYMVRTRWGLGGGYQRWNSQNLYKISVSLMLL